MIAKLPEAVQQQVNQKISELLTKEVEQIAVLVYEIAYRQAVKDAKVRIVKHCEDRAAWLLQMQTLHPTEPWGVKKIEVDFLAAELRGFSEEAQ